MADYFDIILYIHNVFKIKELDELVPQSRLNNIIMYSSNSKLLKLCNITYLADARSLLFIIKLTPGQDYPLITIGLL